jgi:hypothetical protein
MATSPSTDNYQIGKGIMSISEDSGSNWRDMGNVSEAEWTPNVDKLDHFSSRQGIKTKDKSVVVTSAATLRYVMDEVTAENIRQLALGDIETDTDGNSVIKSMTLSGIEALIKIEGTNDVGLKTDFIGKVNIIPSGSFNFISEEWNTMEVTADMVQDDLYGLGQFTIHDAEVTA